jgi:CRP-like cAMP-binding protein
VLGEFIVNEIAVDFARLTSMQEGRAVQSGDIVFKAGDEGHEMYIIRSGKIEIRIAGQLVDTVGENGVFGEMALIDGSRRSATAIAIEDSVVVPVSEQQFLFMVQQTPFFALNVMRTLAQRLRKSNRD